VRIGRETRESLIFVIGLLGLVSQGFVLPLLDKPISIPLCLLFLTMAGVIGVPVLLDLLTPSVDRLEERRRADERGDPRE
jgi:hypothetical protein